MYRQVTQPATLASVNTGVSLNNGTEECTTFLHKLSEQVIKISTKLLTKCQKSEREDRESIMVRENGGRERERKEERERG